MTLIGPAGRLQASITLTGGPIKLLFHGQPGIGKSELAKSLARRLVKDMEIDRLNGADCRVERVRELSISLRNRSMFSDWNVVLIEELDMIPDVAQALILTLLDELPAHCAVFATSNKNSKALALRLWTRFERYEVQPPTDDELTELLSGLAVPPEQIPMIVATACGNVRAALLDVQSWQRRNPEGAQLRQLALLMA